MLLKMLIVMAYYLVVNHVGFSVIKDNYRQSNCCSKITIEKPILKQMQNLSNNSVTDKPGLFRNNIKVISIRIPKIRTVLDKSDRNFNTSAKILFKYHRLKYLFMFGICYNNKLLKLCIQKYKTRILIIYKSDIVPMRC